MTRCVALAEELSDFEVDITFTCQSENRKALSYFRNLGFQVLELPPADTVVDDIFELIQRARQSADIDWLVVDNYGVDSAWLNSARVVASKIAVIDDLANRDLPCDLVVNQNLGFSERDYSGLVAPSTPCLVGSTFALLRKDFRERRSFDVLNRRGVVHRILVFYGAADPNDNARRTVEALGQLEQPDLHVDLVMGLNYEYLDDLREMVETLDISVVVHAGVSASEMADLMKTSDVCIGASGSTNWERCCLGLPTLIMVIADNQVKVADALSKGGYAVSLGRDTSISSSQLRMAINEFIGNPQRLMKISRRAAQLIDGHGARRVAEFMLAT